MHTISMPHVFKSDLNIRDGLGENLKSPKSLLGPQGVLLHGKRCECPQSHAWEAEGLSPSAPHPLQIHPLQFPWVERAPFSAHSSSEQEFPRPQCWLWDAG